MKYCMLLVVTRKSCSTYGKHFIYISIHLLRNIHCYFFVNYQRNDFTQARIKMYCV